MVTVAEVFETSVLNKDTGPSQDQLSVGRPEYVIESAYCSRIALMNKIYQ